MWFVVGGRGRVVRVKILVVSYKLCYCMLEGGIYNGDSGDSVVTL